MMSSIGHKYYIFASNPSRRVDSHLKHESTIQSMNKKTQINENWAKNFLICLNKLKNRLLEKFFIFLIELSKLKFYKILNYLKKELTKMC